VQFVERLGESALPRLGRLGAFDREHVPLPVAVRGVLSELDRDVDLDGRDPGNSLA